MGEKINGNTGIYALYKGEKFIDDGTKKELAEKYGWKLSTMNFWASGVNRRRIESRKYQNALRLVRIDKIDDDEE